MACSYPGFEVVDRLPQYFQDRERCGPVVRTWRGMIQPFGEANDASEVEHILADLAADRIVYVTCEGLLRHDPDCHGDHGLHEDLRPGRRLDDQYRVEIAYRTPPGHPIVRSLQPEITKKVFPDATDQPPHLLQPLDALCILFPPNREWSWEVHTAREYVDFTSIWLAKHTLWMEMRERLGPGRGRWIGSAVSHDPAEVLRVVRPQDPCPCGSARRYGVCHREEDQRKVGGRSRSDREVDQAGHRVATRPVVQ